MFSLEYLRAPTEVLGPILFVIYISTLVDKSKQSEIFLYADDLKMFKEIKTDEDTNALQQDLDSLYDWTRYSCLKFHPEKCVAMRYKSSKNNEKCFYNMDQTLLRSRHYFRSGSVL